MLDPDAVQARMLARDGRDLARLRSWLALLDPAEYGSFAGLGRLVADLPTGGARRRRAPTRTLAAGLAALSPGEQAAIADLLRHLDHPLAQGVCAVTNRAAGASPSHDLSCLVRDFRFRFRVYANPPPPDMPETRVIVIGEIMDGENFETLARTLLRYNGQALVILRGHYGFA